MKQLVILTLFSVAVSQPDQVVTGYLMQSEASFCMDECGEYYIETFGDMYWPVVFNNDIDNIHLYTNRYVEVGIGQEVTCVECSAYEVESIALSDDCMFPVNCFVDPCEVAPECQINTPTECVANYCGGCHADFYDLDGNLVDCNIPVEECDDIEENYLALHSGEYAECEYDIDCMPVWGHCGDGLGDCHYAVNSSYLEGEVNELVDLWIQNQCMQWVCTCLELPYAVCNDSTCELAYCSEPNPAGCFETGCPEGYACIDDSNYCTASTCGCDEASDFWWCTEDCGGGTCHPLGDIIFGDINNDSLVNVLDIVLIVSFILMTDEPTDAEFSAGDVNSDEQLNVLDVVAIIQMILNPLELSEDCYIEPEVGPCLGLCPTYYFNQTTNECEEFMTGCCGVEAFNTMGACINTCE